jgi:ferredoxin
MAATGLAEVAERYGAGTAYLSADGYDEVGLEKWLQLPRVHIARMALDADVVVNVPKCKTHMQTLYTGAIKNMFGALAPRQRMDLHALGTLTAVSEAIADLYSACVPELHIMDAIVGMHGTGPARGRPLDLGLVAVSRDGVALDRVATEVMGYKPGRVRMIEAAGELACGESRLEMIDVQGAEIDDVRRRCLLPATAFANIPPSLSQAARRFLYVRPRVNPRACRACGACAEVCPAQAIEMGGVAKIDYGRCIECFCCQEACRFDAIDVRRSLLARLVT